MINIKSYLAKIRINGQREKEKLLTAQQERGNQLREEWNGQREEEKLRMTHNQWEILLEGKNVGSTRMKSYLLPIETTAQS